MTEKPESMESLLGPEFREPSVGTSSSCREIISVKRGLTKIQPRPTIATSNSLRTGEYKHLLNNTFGKKCGFWDLNAGLIPYLSDMTDFEKGTELELSHFEGTNLNNRSIDHKVRTNCNSRYSEHLVSRVFHSNEEFIKAESNSICFESTIKLKQKRIIARKNYFRLKRRLQPKIRATETVNSDTDEENFELPIQEPDYEKEKNYKLTTHYYCQELGKSFRQYMICNFCCCNPCCNPFPNCGRNCCGNGCTSSSCCSNSCCSSCYCCDECCSPCCSPSQSRSPTPPPRNPCNPCSLQLNCRCPCPPPCPNVCKEAPKIPCRPTKPVCRKPPSPKPPNCKKRRKRKQNCCCCPFICCYPGCCPTPNPQMQMQGYGHQAANLNYGGQQNYGYQMALPAMNQGYPYPYPQNGLPYLGGGPPQSCPQKARRTTPTRTCGAAGTTFARYPYDAKKYGSNSQTNICANRNRTSPSRTAFSPARKSPRPNYSRSATNLHRSGHNSKTRMQPFGNPSPYNNSYQHNSSRSPSPYSPRVAFSPYRYNSRSRTNLSPQPHSAGSYSTIPAPYGGVGGGYNQHQNNAGSMPNPCCNPCCCPIYFCCCPCPKKRRKKPTTIPSFIIMKPTPPCCGPCVDCCCDCCCPCAPGNCDCCC